MPRITPTHINAYYADLIVAKQEAAVANQKVTELQDSIVAQGFQLPDADGSFPDPEEQLEDTADQKDVSAAEEQPAAKKFSKKGDK